MTFYDLVGMEKTTKYDFIWLDKLWHLGKNLEGQSRMDEQELFLKDFIDIVEENKVDLVIIAGDVYDSSNIINCHGNNGYNLL